MSKNKSKDKGKSKTGYVSSACTGNYSSRHSFLTAEEEQQKRKSERSEGSQTPRLSARVLQATEPWQGTSDDCNDITRFALAQSVALPTIALVLLDGSNKQNELPRRV